MEWTYPHRRRRRIVVDAAHDDRVELQRANPARRRLDAVEHRRVLVEPRQRLEAVADPACRG